MRRFQYNIKCAHAALISIQDPILLQTSRLFLKYLVKESIFLSNWSCSPRLHPTFSLSLNLVESPFSVASFCLPTNRPVRTSECLEVMYMLSFVSGSKSKVIPNLNGILLSYFATLAFLIYFMEMMKGTRNLC